MYKIDYNSNNQIKTLLIFLIVCLYLSACSKDKSETVFQDSKVLESVTEVHTDQNSPTISPEESDETILKTELTKKESVASEYILPGSESRFYTITELGSLSTAELRLARNEIFARHGRIFTAGDLQQYFFEKSWYFPQYTPEEFEQKGDTLFNKYEIANCDLIVTVEQLANYKDILKEKQFRRLYVSTERFFDYKQPHAQIIDHGSYYEVTHGCIMGEDSFDQSVMDGKYVGDTLELDNVIYHITEITIWNSGDGETVNLELVSEGEGIEECYKLSRNYSDSYYTPYYYDGIMTADILYSGSLYFSKDCIVEVNDPYNEYRSHSVTIEDFFTLDGDEVGAQFGGYSGGLSLWGVFDTDSTGMIISYEEHFLS